MNKLNTNGSWLDLHLFFHEKVNLYVDNFFEPPSNDGINIALVCEPQEISKNKNFVINNKEKYDVILTFDSEIMRMCENAEFFEFGSCWIEKSFDYDIKKNFEVSFLVGGKLITNGHLLRQQIWDNQKEIKIPKNFFNSSTRPYPTNIKYNSIKNKKDELFYSQFHICIENNRSEGYFSEKLIDCLYTKTIPIYWGCLDIDKWFDTKSIFVVNSFEEIIQCCNNLTPDLYKSLNSEIEFNYKKCLEFYDYKERVSKKITEIVSRFV